MDPSLPPNPSKSRQESTSSWTTEPVQNRVYHYPPSRAVINGHYISRETPSNEQRSYFLSTSEQANFRNNLGQEDKGSNSFGTLGNQFNAPLGSGGSTERNQTDHQQRQLSSQVPTQPRSRVSSYSSTNNRSGGGVVQKIGDDYQINQKTGIAVRVLPLKLGAPIQTKPEAIQLAGSEALQMENRIKTITKQMEDEQVEFEIEKAQMQQELRRVESCEKLAAKDRQCIGLKEELERRNRQCIGLKEELERCRKTQKMMEEPISSKRALEQLDKVVSSKRALEEMDKVEPEEKLNIITSLFDMYIKYFRPPKISPKKEMKFLKQLQQKRNQVEEERKQLAKWFLKWSCKYQYECNCFKYQMENCISKREKLQQNEEKTRKKSDEDNPHISDRLGSEEEKKRQQRIDKLTDEITSSKKSMEQNEQKLIQLSISFRKELQRLEEQFEELVENLSCGACNSGDPDQKAQDTSGGIVIILPSAWNYPYKP